MVRDILKRDLKRKKTMNIILLLFVILSTMFVASSVNNIITVATGTDYFFEKAELGDYMILTNGDYGRKDLKLEEKESVESYRQEDIIYASAEKIKFKGQKIEAKNVNILQSLEDAKMNFFNENNEIVRNVSKGKVYITSRVMKNNGIEVGDKITIEAGNAKKEFEVAGRLKDALFGSEIMGNARFLMSREDFEYFNADEVAKNQFGGRVYYIETSDPDLLTSELSDTKGLAFNDGIALVKSSYMMDMVVAGILMILSICLILVSFVVLKFTITFTLTEEFREIGVMKAIGIRNLKIRSLYVIKYLAIALVGAVVGFGASIPFSELTIKSVSDNMVLGNDLGIGLYIISSIVLVVIIAAYAFFCTRKIKKLSPLDAIRNGQTGERFKKKSKLRIERSKSKTTSFLAVNDVLSSPRRHITIMIAFIICSLLVFMLINVSETMKSDSLITTFSKKSDAYYVNVKSSMECMTGKGNGSIEKEIRRLEKLLKDNGIEAEGSIDVQYKYKLLANGEEYIVSCQKGINSRADEYEYYEGTAPQNANEIAVTNVMAKKLGVSIGDTVEITINGKTQEYLVTAYFQSMNLLGKVIRLHEDVETDMADSSSMLAFQFDFKDNPSQKEIDERVEKMKEIFDDDEVYNAAGYCEDCVGVAGSVDALKYLLLAITLIVIILVTVLMERSFISEEKGEIAILKAVGFSNGAIIRWHMKRFIMVGIVSVLIAVAISVPMTSICFNPVFGIMGMKTISYHYNLLQVFLVYPAIIIAVTIISAVLTALYTRHISSSDTSSIE